MSTNSPDFSWILTPVEQSPRDKELIEIQEHATQKIVDAFVPKKKLMPLDQVVEEAGKAETREDLMAFIRKATGKEVVSVDVEQPAADTLVVRVPAEEMAAAVVEVEVSGPADAPGLLADSRSAYEQDKAQPVEPPAGTARRDPQQEEFLKLLEDGNTPRYMAIMGGAGTGKTYLARKMVESCAEAELCATTGIAALNLGAGVTTINSLVGFFDTASLRDMWITGQLVRKLGRLCAAGMRKLVIDEMSMMQGEQLTIFTKAFDDLDAAGIPMSMVLVGDFCQLPPVPDRGDKNSGKFAFETDEFEKFRGGIVRLDTIHRQADADFIQALRAVRRGDRTAAGDYFVSKLERTMVQEFPGTTILAKNAEVDRFNALKHAQLRAESHEWRSTRWGKERSEWKNVPPALSLKIGALVMILANEKEIGLDGQPTGEYLYVNGDLGTLESWTDLGWARVKLHRNGRTVAVNMVTRENLVPLDKERRRELKKQQVDQSTEELLRGAEPQGAARIRGDREEWEAIGALTYMPLRLAWATTVHKSQGLTLDNVQVSIADHFWETGGMLYVALSRARTATGLRICGSKELFLKRINTDPRVKEWL